MFVAAIVLIAYTYAVKLLLTMEDWVWVASRIFAAASAPALYWLIFYWKHRLPEPGLLADALFVSVLCCLGALPFVVICGVEER